MTTDASRKPEPVYTEEQFQAALQERVQEAVSGATSRVQSELAATQRRLSEVTIERDQAAANTTLLTAENEGLKKSESYSEDVAEFASWRAGEISRIKQRNEQLERDARNIRTEQILDEFDGSRAELDSFRTAEEMEIYALRNWKRTGEAIAGDATDIQGTVVPPLGGVTPQPDSGAGNVTGGAVPADTRGLDKIALGLANRNDTPGR